MVSHTSSTEQAINEASQLVDVYESNNSTNDYREIDRVYEKKAAEAVSRGEVDARKNIPSGEGHSPYERSLINQFNAKFTSLITNEENALVRLKNAFNSILSDYITTPLGKLYNEVSEIKQGFRQAKILHERPGGQTDAVSGLLMNLWVVYAILIVLGIMELPLNNTIFQGYRLGEWETLLAAAILVVAIPFLAHYGGKALKRWNSSRGMKILASSILVLFFFFATWLGLYRYVFFRAQDLYNTMIVEDSSVLFSDMMNQVSYWEAFESSEFWVGFVLNLMLLILGLILGYYSHDSNHEFEKHYLNYHKRRPKLIAKIEDMEQAEKRGSEAVGSIRASREVRDKLTQIETLHNALYQYVKSFTRYTNQLLSDVLNQYQSSNMAHRTDDQEVPEQWMAHHQDQQLIALPDHSLSNPISSISYESK
jgi:hypothetical protein